MHFVPFLAAFAEGLALVASPCILPVLPLVLGASAGEGKKKPFGVIAGFVLSFSLFALASRKLVLSLGIGTQWLTSASLLLLFMMGLVMLSRRLSDAFSARTQGLASFGGGISQTSRDGFYGGMASGALIGLVWTPCAGPIMAAALVQAIRGQTNMESYGIVMAFALGAGVPMLLIALLGKRLTARLGFLQRHAEGIRRTLGALMVATVAILASGYDASLLLPSSHATPGTMPENSGGGAPYPAAELTGIDQWLNSAPLTLSELKGHVVLVDFWTYSCINCLRTLPFIKAWDETYRDKGLVILGVHSPEFEFEKDPNNVRDAVKRLGIRYPVALDNHLATWTQFHNQYWPAHYLINREGSVVYTHFGEGAYDATENAIRNLLGMHGALSPTQPPVSAPRQTPETYLGFARAERFAGISPLVKNRAFSYESPLRIPKDSWALQGRWKAEAEKITALEPGARILLHFNGGKAFAVLGNASAPVRVKLLLGGQPVGEIIVNGHKLYELVAYSPSHAALLELQSETAGLEAYSFTFGD